MAINKLGLSISPEISNIIYAITPVLLAIIGKLSFDNRKLKHKINSGAYDVYYRSRDFYDFIHHKILPLMDSTAADRFLIALGYDVDSNRLPHTVTIEFEKHKDHQYLELSTGAVFKYKGIPVDDVYRQYVNESKQSIKFLSTKNMQEGVLKKFYEDEKVLCSSVFFIDDREVDNTNIILFGSLASHSVNDYSIVDRSKIKQVLNDLEQLSESIVVVKNKKLAQ